MNLLNSLAGFLGGDNGLVTLSCMGESLTLPVDPSEFYVSVSNQNGSVNIINVGEYAMIGKTGLKEITLTSIFPAHAYSFNNFAADTDPYAPVEQIESWRVSGYPLNIMITNSPISFDCLVESFEYGENDGTGDVSYRLKLKEYRKIDTAGTKEDLTTGLKKRPQISFLQRAGLDMGKRMLKGETPMQAITGAVRAGGLNQVQHGYLDIFKTVSKSGGLSTGDMLKVHGANILKDGIRIAKLGGGKNV